MLSSKFQHPTAVTSRISLQVQHGHQFTRRPITLETCATTRCFRVALLFVAGVGGGSVTARVLIARDGVDRVVLALVFFAHVLLARVVVARGGVARGSIARGGISRGGISRVVVARGGIARVVVAHIVSARLVLLLACGVVTGSG